VLLLLLLLLVLVLLVLLLLLLLLLTGRSVQQEAQLVRVALDGKLAQLVVEVLNLQQQHHKHQGWDVRKQHTL